MFSSIAGKSLWERRRSIIIWSVAMVGFMLMYASLYPSIGNTGNYEEIFAELPDAFTTLFGGLESLGTPEGYMYAEGFSLTLPLFMLIIGVGFGAGAIAKEEESGTLELLLASPVSRGKILYQKAVAIKLNLLIVAAAIWSGIALGVALVDGFDISLVSVLWATINLVLMGLLFGYIALAITAFGFGRAAALGGAIGLFILMYLANTFAQLVEWMEPFKYGSAMYYLDTNDVLFGSVNWAHMALIIGVIMLLYGAAHLRFRVRDTGV